MATEQMFTSLPTVGSSTLQDIICAVQGYVASPLNLGLSTQQTLQQVYNLFQSNIILYNAGNPNGAVAGTTFQFCWDTTDKQLFICTTSGTSSTAVWTLIATFNPVSFAWVAVTSSPVNMVSNYGYLDTNVPLTTFVLPLSSNFGDKINVVGNAAGGWTITQNAGQKIVVGSSSSTIGIGGSVSSTNQYDSIELLCVQANFGWQALVAPQGNLTIV